MFLQYWYDGDEAGDLAVDFSIVWDGDFLIDKPTFMKGKKQVVLHKLVKKKPCFVILLCILCLF